MKRYMSSNVCFNFYTNPDVVSVNDAICDYDVYIIFAECISEDELIPKFDDVEEAVVKIVSNKEYSDDYAAHKITMVIDELYKTYPVIDVIIKRRKFPEG